MAGPGSTPGPDPAIGRRFLWPVFGSWSSLCSCALAWTLLYIFGVLVCVGLDIRVKSMTIVVLDRIPYGLPKEAIMNAVAKYGVVSGYKAITHKGYSMSKFRLEIELRQDIPSRINVQGNPINIFYKNQPRSCFVCREASHEAKNCARKAGPARPPNQSTGLLSFATITAGAKKPIVPAHTDEGIADPLSTKEPGQQPKLDELPTMDMEESDAVVD